MKPNAPTTNVLTFIGMMASVAGILLCLFLLFTPVTFGAMELIPLSDRSADLHMSMRWIQPILGQAIVEDALIRLRSHGSASTAPVMEAASKAGSVQWLLGRLIVELSRSRMVGGQADGQIVIIARHAAEQYEEGLVEEARATKRL